MAEVNTVATLNGLFKTVYAKELENLVPDYAILQKRVAFAGQDKETGNFYAQPVNLAHEAGFSYLGTAGGVSTLSDAVSGVMKEAQVYGSELVLRSQLSYAALTRASQKGPKAFKKASAWKVEDMNNSTRKRLEIAMLYGQKGIGTVDSITSGSGTGTIIMTAASWAGGIWAGAEGALLDSFTGTTLNNSGGPIKITAVNSDTRTLSVTCTGTFSAECAAGDVLYFRGAAVDAQASWNEMAGLQAIISNTGTLFNIAANTYSLWAGTTVSSVGQISHSKIQDAVARAVNKGLMEKCIVLVSPKAWGVLNSDQAALRMFDQSYSSSKVENGAESLTFHAANGALEVVCHPMVKDGDLFVVPLDSVARIGSVDLTFGLPGLDDQFISWVPTQNAVELRCMCDQAIFLTKPAHAVYGSGLTYA